MKMIQLLLIGALLCGAAELAVKITPGAHWNHSFKMGLMTIHTTPQFAVWIADRDGNYVTTFMVTEKSAKSKYKGARKSRPGALPVWSHTRGLRGDKGNFMPTKKLPLTDAITQASSTEETVIRFTLPDSLSNRDVVLRVEVNGSMDFNELYQKKLKKTDKGFNNGVNGQPSLVYEAPISKEVFTDIPLELIGYGEAAGRDGEIRTDLEGITTALELVESITFTRSAE